MRDKWAPTKPNVPRQRRPCGVCGEVQVVAPALVCPSCRGTKKATRVINASKRRNANKQWSTGKKIVQGGLPSLGKKS